MSGDIVLGYAQRLYRIAIDFSTALEIEDEVGSLAEFYERLMGGHWTLGELVTVCHILLGQAGCEPDYMVLGQEIVSHGVARYRGAVMQALECIFTRQ